MCRRLSPGSRFVAVSLTILGTAATLHAAPMCGTEIVFDFSPFEFVSVVGELWNLTTIEGEIVHGRIDAVFVSNEEAPWDMYVNFELPTGVDGVASQTEGWSGTGTFTTSIETDAFNGFLVIPGGESFVSWFIQYAAGTPFEPPGGGIGLTVMDGYFEQLTLTLTLADCPTGDLDGDIAVGFSDLLVLLSVWGDCPRGESCAADLDHDGNVGFGDLLILLNAWGDDDWCPPPFC